MLRFSQMECSERSLADQERIVECLWETSERVHVGGWVQAGGWLSSSPPTCLPWGGGCARLGHHGYPVLKHLHGQLTRERLEERVGAVGEQVAGADHGAVEVAQDPARDRRWARRATVGGWVGSCGWVWGG